MIAPTLGTAGMRAPAAAASWLIGALIGLERRKTGKPVGVRTFGGVALAFTVAWWESPSAADALFGICILFVTALNVRSLVADQSLEITTSVAILITALLGVLVAQEEALGAAACGVLVTVLLAWKAGLGEFAGHVTVSEVRGALLLGLLGVVIYPLLPVGPIDPWGLVDLRNAWVGVLAISGIGFLNYLILRLWGARVIGWTGLLGGFVNSRAVAVELARRARGDPSRLWPFAIFGVLTANVAMIVRNALILALFAPQTLRWGWLPLGGMCAAALVLAAAHRIRAADPVPLRLDSPVALRPVLTFGAVYLAISMSGEVAQRDLGHAGFLVVTVLGGIVSSASSVVAAATLAGQGKVAPAVAAAAVVLTCMTTLLSNVPAVQIAGRNRACSARLALLSGAIALAGLVGLILEFAVRSGLLAG